MIHTLSTTMTSFDVNYAENQYHFQPAFVVENYADLVELIGLGFVVPMVHSCAYC